MSWSVVGGGDDEVVPMDIDEAQVEQFTRDIAALRSSQQPEQPLPPPDWGRKVAVPKPIARPAVQPAKPSKLPNGAASAASAALVLDTNYFISHLPFLEAVLRCLPSPHIQFVVPYAVIKELDSLKDNHKRTEQKKAEAVMARVGDPGAQAPSMRTLSDYARKANSFLHQHLQFRNPGLRGQQISERSKDSDAHEITADDRILDCCRFMQEMPGKKVLLLSNDKNLCVKALVHGIPTVSAYKEGPAQFLRHIGQVLHLPETLHMSRGGSSVSVLPSSSSNGSTRPPIAQYIAPKGVVHAWEFGKQTSQQYQFQATAPTSRRKQSLDGSNGTSSAATNQDPRLQLTQRAAEEQQRQKDVFKKKSMEEEARKKKADEKKAADVERRRKNLLAQKATEFAAREKAAHEKAERLAQLELDKAKAAALKAQKKLAADMLRITTDMTAKKQLADQAAEKLRQVKLASPSLNQHAGKANASTVMAGPSCPPLSKAAAKRKRAAEAAANPTPAAKPPKIPKVSSNKVDTSCIAMKAAPLPSSQPVKRKRGSDSGLAPEPSNDMMDVDDYRDGTGRESPAKRLRPSGPELVQASATFADIVAQQTQQYETALEREIRVKAQIKQGTTADPVDQVATSMLDVLPQLIGPVVLSCLQRHPPHEWTLVEVPERGPWDLAHLCAILAAYWTQLFPGQDPRDMKLAKSLWWCKDMTRNMVRARQYGRCMATMGELALLIDEVAGIGRILYAAGWSLDDKARLEECLKQWLRHLHPNRLDLR
ncbi:hypothetical protein HKX48_006121 [Thoreauomyces humboldtii]|nr:hypothetical protein HKX48_006121 [Thoreauomyces humboldtii]